MNESPRTRRSRRADRLIRIIERLRDGERHLARDIARAEGVSLRTVYRDMETLVASGVPVAGSRGRGYRMSAQVTLPALNLTMDEMEALHLGIAVMADAADPSLRRASRSLAGKLDTALPESRIGPSQSWSLAVHPFADTTAAIRHMAAMRAALRARRRVRITYAEEAGDTLVRVVRPLKLDYWGRVWTCQAWCERTRMLVNLRLDLIGSVEELPPGAAEPDPAHTGPKH